jgi:hypothetical protein
MAPDRAIWWSFRQEDGWAASLGAYENYHQRSTESLRPGQVLRVMAPGKLDVVKVARARMEVVGFRDTHGRKPETFERRGGNYLLCNGGFWTPNDPDVRQPVGSTMLAGNRQQPHVDIDGTYAPYYHQLFGYQRRTWIWSGPSLKTPPD